MARIGYGYERKQSDFAAAKVSQVFIDDRGSERLERTDMFIFGLRGGDTLVLLARGDLGRGGELPGIYALLRERGVKMEVFSNKEPGKAGRPPGIVWPDGEEAKHRKMWHSTKYHGPYVIRSACTVTGEADEQVMRNYFNANFGPRSKPKQK